MALWGIGLGWRWLSILLDFAGWIVFLVGLSILQHRCDVVTSSTLNTFGEDGGISSGVFFVPANNQLGGVTSDLPLLPATNHLIGTSDYFNTPSRCRYLYSFPWWLMAYQFFLLVIYAILHTRKATYGTSRAALAALTAYGLYLATEVTDYFFHIRYSALGSPYRLSGPIKAVFAGALVMAAAKGFLLLGLLFPHEEEVGRKVTKVEATTYTTAATPPTVSHV